MGEILYSAKDYSSIFVSYGKPDSWERLKQALDEDKRYSKRKIANVIIRERFVTQVFCIACDNNRCKVSPILLWNDKPQEIKCEICNTLYFSLS